MSINKIVIGALIISGTLAAGCRTNLLQVEDVPPPSRSEPIPLVVDGTRTSYADIVERTSPAVVRIEASRREKAQTRGQMPFGDDFFRQFQIPQPDRRPQIERGVGSGVIVDAAGTVMTNFHVVEGADKITVLTNDNKSYDAKIVGTDAPSDLAVLKIEGAELPSLKLGDSDSVRVGDIVLAIGNPLGIGQTVTAGIISAKGRRTGLGDGSFEDFLQTDAPINRGNSGGALVNLNGELIGINSQILSGGPGGGNIGIAFSIPSNMARSIMEQLLKDGKVRRGMLGVNIQSITDDTAKAIGLTDTSGALVSNVRSGSAADKAGVKRNDVIRAINGERIEDSNALRNKIAGTLPGTEVKLTILRDGKEVEVTVTLDELDPGTTVGTTEPGNSGNPRPGAENQSEKLGLSLEPLTAAAAKRLGVEESAGGMVITNVDPNGPAAEAGLSDGDVILEINRKSVKSLADVNSAIESAENRPILLLVSSRGQTVFVTIRP
jgi:Do/DeqQ family serine protease